MKISLEIIEQQLIESIKSKNQLAVDTLRGLKTRIQNEQITQGGELSESELFALVKSEAKRRKEAAESFLTGGREDQAQKEQQELEILSQFLPEQVSEADLAKLVDQKISENGWSKSDFGPAMGQLKAHFGDSVDGSVLSQILKDKLTES